VDNTVSLLELGGKVPAGDATSWSCSLLFTVHCQTEDDD